MEVEVAASGPRRRPFSAVVNAGDASSRSRKRVHLSPSRSPSPLPRRLRGRIVFDDYGSDDDGLVDRSDAENDGNGIIFGDDSSDDDGRDRPEAKNDGTGGDDEVEADVDGGEGDERSGSETEYDPLDVYNGGDVVGDQQPPSEEEGSDDDGPLRFVRQGGGGDQRPQQPAEEEEDSDDDRPILFRSRSVLRRGSTAPAPAPAAVEEEESDDFIPTLRVRTVAGSGSTAPAPVMAPPAPREPLPAMAPPAPRGPSPSPSNSSSSSVIRDATVEKNTGVDCGICYLPLKPPIFQCGVGHVVCSRCAGRLGEASRCHKCRAPMPDGYRRCHDMESLVDSIRVPCPHAAHGCAARPVYHGRDDHARACPHAPCHCPGEACGFAGSTAALVDHLVAVHSWPCTYDDDDGYFVVRRLRDGFNFFITGTRAAAAPDQGAAVAADRRFLFMLNVERAPPFGRAITAFCVHRDRAATASINIICTRRYMRSVHLQSSEFEVACTDLSNGLPAPSSDCFRFVVPGSGCEEEDATTKVILGVTPPPIQ